MSKFKSKKLIIKSFKSIPGLYYVENTNLDLSSIIKKLDEKNWISVSNHPNSRKVQHYGYKYGYRSYDIHQKTDPIPNFLLPLQKKLIKIAKFKKIINEDYVFNQCIINNYVKNQGISKHIDVKDYGNVIGCYTTGSGATMRFRLGKEKVDIYTKPNSLYIMSGDARYKWTHEMPSNLSDLVDGKRIKRGRRISITFRNVYYKK